eukprot:m.13321 g.13321  ORF g.13321 m.13321 type:complete len:377 (+) comp4647_c0_seq1:273-1403(+)
MCIWVNWINRVQQPAVDHQRGRPFGTLESSPKRLRMERSEVVRSEIVPWIRTVLPHDEDKTEPAAIAVREVYKAAGCDLEPIKLQKLLYFSNVICAVVFERPLISTDFEAWQYGPVEPDVYSEYTGRAALPYKPHEGLPPASALCKACVRWAVAAHKKDPPHVIREKSRTKPWRDARNPRNMHVPIQFESIKEYYSIAEHFVPEVLPFIIEEVSSQASTSENSTRLFHELLVKLARIIVGCDIFYGLDHIELSPVVARRIHPEVVVWPGQNPWAALKVAVIQPYGLYDVFYTPPEGRTAESLTELASLLGLVTGSPKPALLISSTIRRTRCPRVTTPRGLNPPLKSTCSVHIFPSEATMRVLLRLGGTVATSKRRS